MRERLTPNQIAEIFQRQFEVWKGTPNAKQIIEDCCSALGHAGFCMDHEELVQFRQKCGF